MNSLCRLIAAMPTEQDGDLMLCREHGLAYQLDRAHGVAYDAAYFERTGSHPAAMVDAINDARIALVARHIGAAPVLDIGIGSGEFIRRRPNTWGRDVNPVAVDWLKTTGRLAESFEGFAGLTMWDVIEHLHDPEQYLRHIRLHAWLFVSVPLVYALGGIRLSRHYRPGEHLTYWTEEGFLAWMDAHGFRCFERNDAEIQAGRESIYSFAFRRYRWPA